MTRLADSWRALEREQRLATLAALALLVTMFFPWYGLQNLNRKTGAIYSHNINAFGDVSFVEAAVFIVAAGVVVMVLARAEGREFHLPGGDGITVMIAGAWAGLLIFYRVFDRPAGDGYPVGIEWGFFLAFVAAGSLVYAGARMRAAERPQPRPARTDGGPDRGARNGDPSHRRAGGQEDSTALAPAPAPTPGEGSSPVAANRTPPRERPRYPPAPSKQMSFEDPPPRSE